MRRFTYVLVVLTAVALTVNSVQANVITNGDFSGNAAAFTADLGYASSGGNPDTPAGWTKLNFTNDGYGNVGINGLDTGGGTPFTALGPADQTAVRDYAFLHGNWYLEQSVSLVAGQQYNLDFLAAGRNGFSGGELGFLVGDNIAQYTAVWNIVPSNLAFGAYSYSFTAPATINGTPIVRFYQTGVGDAVVSLSNITLNAVPEPSTLVLAGMGLVGLVAYAWRKRKCVSSQS